MSELILHTSYYQVKIYLVKLLLLYTMIICFSRDRERDRERESEREAILTEILSSVLEKGDTNIIS